MPRSVRLVPTISATGRGPWGFGRCSPAIRAGRADSAWTDSTVTFGTVPAETGTAVNAAAGAGWMQWTVTAHVQAQYAGSNNGFLVRDGTESGGTDFTQVFDSREATNQPELLLTWQ